jgi:cytochrome b subunit of formate dehydrogenase
MRLSAKYGIRSDRFKTFSNSYHGLAIRGGDPSVANCASCHGFHDVRRSSDPLSRVNKANLQATCGKCHPGADARFASGKVHVTANEADEPVLYWVSFLYVGLIVVVIGGMLFHNILDFVRKSRRVLRIRRGLEPEPHHPQALYLRMSVNERLQHGLLVLSFAALVVTGFMLHYPDAFWVTWLRRLSDRLFDYRYRLHRTAGVLMVVTAVYHGFYLAFSARGRRLVRDLLPVVGDAKGALGAMAYYLGLRKTPPRFPRFSYIEKAEYWALVWGTLVMAATGAILWFEEQAIGLFGKLGWDVARLVHFYEAWLATLAILVWHIYFVIFNPEVYPMNLAWLTGTLTEEEMAAEHPLELEAIRREREETARRDAEEAARKKAADEAGTAPSADAE